MYVQRLWDVLLGEYPPQPPRELPIITSICYYALTVVTGRNLRRLAKHTLPDSVLPYVLDIMTAWQLMSCSLENGQIRKHYGSVAYVLTLFTMGMWNYSTIRDGSCSNPCAHIIRWMKGQHNKKTLLLRVICQLIGGLSSFPYARLFWYLELTESHASRYRMIHCTTDLTVPTPVGFLLEFGATYFDVLLCLTTFTPFLFYEVATKSMLGCIMVILGVDLTGMYMNPINATNQTFGCRGIHTLEFVLVYWVSVFLAAVLGVITHQQITQCWKVVQNEEIAERITAKSSQSYLNEEKPESELLGDEIYNDIESEVIKEETVELSEDEIFCATEKKILEEEKEIEAEKENQICFEANKAIKVIENNTEESNDSSNNANYFVSVPKSPSQNDKIEIIEPANNITNNALSTEKSDDLEKEFEEFERLERLYYLKMSQSCDSIQNDILSERSQPRSTHHRRRSKSGSRIPIKERERKRSTSRSRIPVKIEQGREKIE